MPSQDPEKRRAFSRAWYYRHHEKNKKKNRLRGQRNRANRYPKQAREFKLFKESIGCKKCGWNKHGSALDYHHRNPKKKHCLVKAHNFRTPTGITERKKCDLLCANCHRIETFS